MAMKRLLPIFIFALSFAAAARAVNTPILLPSSFGGWNASAPSTIAPPAGLDQILGMDATGFREYVVKSVEQRSYTQGSQTASITLYRLRDPSSAYGAYTFLRNDSLAIANFGNYSSESKERALVVVGEMLLDISVPAGQGRPADGDIKQLADLLDKSADHTPYPSIGDHLPNPGRIPKSERYFIGPRSLSQFVPIGTDDWVGFDHSAETIVARYHMAGQDETLLIASYPTQQIAALKFDGMLRRFTFDPPGDIPADQTVLFGKRVSSIVAVVVGAHSRQAANKLLDQVGYESQVMWNEPKQTMTDPGIGNMVVGAFVGTGAIMFLAIVAGVGFGGIRIIVKYLFPNKVFDRDKEIEILQLKITGKPIKAKDF